jgi:putative peptide zinc metalloprotease protein
VLSVPFPCHISAAAIVQPVDARRVFAIVPGRLIEATTEGDLVPEGDLVARLVNTDLEREITRLRGERDWQRLRVENLKRRQVRDETAAAQLPPATELLADLEQRLEQKLVDEQRLTIRAPIAGTVIPPRRSPPTNSEGTLSFWTGTPLDRRNRGCQIETGTLLCQIGDPARLEALVVIDQAEVEFVVPGQAVEVRLDQNPGAGLLGTIAEIAEIDLTAIPPELISHELLATRTDDSGRSRPMSTSYQARVSFSSTGVGALPGETGRARIEVPRRSLGTRLLRVLRSTFEFDLTIR